MKHGSGAPLEADVDSWRSSSDVVGSETRPQQSPCRTQLLRSIRAIKGIVLKGTAHQHPLFGAESKVLSLVVAFRKPPDKKRLHSLQVLLPHPSVEGRPAEGLMLKVDGQRKFVVHIGHCSMMEEMLVRNGVAAITFVRRSFGTRIVRAIQVQEGRLVLPVWGSSMEKRKLPPIQEPERSIAGRVTMVPPTTPVRKKARTC